MNDLDRETQLEQRLSRLEADVARLKAMIPAGGAIATGAAGETAADDRPWWEATAGKFANDPMFEEAMRLGCAWRESFRPKPRPKAKTRLKSGPKPGLKKRTAATKQTAAAGRKPTDAGARHGSR